MERGMRRIHGCVSLMAFKYMHTDEKEWKDAIHVKPQSDVVMASLIDILCCHFETLSVLSISCLMDKKRNKKK